MHIKIFGRISDAYYNIWMHQMIANMHLIFIGTIQMPLKIFGKRRKFINVHIRISGGDVKNHFKNIHFTNF